MDREICVDRILPQDQRKCCDLSSAAHLALFRAEKWPNGSVLKVRLLGIVMTAQAELIKRSLQNWTDHANLSFEYVTGLADIRVSFQEGAGSWSYIGTDARNIPQDQPTMNFGWLDEAVILHEFGHAMGLIHEHQNPVGGITWDKQAVIRDLSGPPNFWSLAQIESNVFSVYDHDRLNASAVDKDSVMMYRIPQHWTVGNFEVGFNEDLSALDKQIIGRPENYPKDTGFVTHLPIWIPFHGTINPGHEDEYEFTVPINSEAIPVSIQTLGKTDVIMQLFDGTTLLAEDDDSGEEYNAQINRALQPGTYRVRVRHYHRETGGGPYQVIIIKGISE